MRLISTFLSRAATLFADRVAIIDGDIELTFSQMMSRVERLADVLRSAGLRPGDRVAVIEVNSHRYLELYYACAQTGIVIVPINIRLSAPEVRYILAD